MNREELLELIPAYAIDALDEEERIEVEALLTEDAEAQSILHEYEAVAEILPFAVPQRPAPSHLRADLKARLAKLPKEESKPPTSSVESQSEASSPDRPRILPFPTSIIASAAAAIVVVILGLVFVLSMDQPDPNPNEVLFNEIIGDSNSSRFDLTPGVAENVEGELVVSADGSQAILKIASLPDTTEDQSYQLWLISNEGSESGGIFHWPTGHGPYYVAINRPISELDNIGMSIEPFDGSPLGNAPSGERLFGVQIAQAQ